MFCGAVPMTTVGGRFVAYYLYSIIAGLICIGTSGAFGAAPDYRQALKVADKARGLSALPLSYSFEVEIFSEDASSTTKKYELVSQNTSAVATLVFPKKSFNEAIVVKGTMVWIARENSRRPALVSLNERMNGSASVGDIMAMHFSESFQVETSEDAAGSKHMKKITLRPTANLIAYEKVVIWLDTKENLVKTAEYRTANAESVKKVSFIYDHQHPESGSGKKEPFVSKMIFTENSEKPAAIVQFGLPKVTEVSKGFFDLENIVDRLSATPK